MYVSSAKDMMNTYITHTLEMNSIVASAAVVSEKKG